MKNKNSKLGKKSLKFNKTTLLELNNDSLLNVNGGDKENPGDTTKTGCSMNPLRTTTITRGNK